MLNRQSSCCPFSLALLRSRSARPSRSTISCRVGRCARSHPFFCQSLKLIAVSDQENFLSLQHPAHKRVSHPEFFRPLGSAQHVRINFPPDLFLFTKQQGIDLVQGNPLI